MSTVFQGLSPSHFEFQIPSAELKKAQKIVAAGHCIRTGSSGGHKHFVVNRDQVSVKKHDKKITAVTCTCSKSPFCAHVAAVLMTLEGLQILEFPKSKTTTKGKITGFSQKIRLLNSQGHQTPLNRSVLKFEAVLEQFVLLNENLSNNDEKQIIAIYKKRLLGHIKRKLAHNETSYLIEALLYSMRSNKSIANNYWRFLFTQTLGLKLKPSQIGTIEEVLNKRRFRVFHAEGPDLLTLSSMQIKLAALELKKAQILALTVEEQLAYVELLIAANKTSLAKQVLGSCMQEDTGKPAIFGNRWLSLARLSAQQLKDKTVLRAVIVRQLMESTQADKQLLQELRELSSLKTYREEIEKIVALTPAALVEKKVELLIQSGNRLALEAVIKTTTLRFGLAMEVLNAMLPLIPVNIETYYCNLVLNELRRSPQREWQLAVMKLSNSYTSRLHPALNKTLRKSLNSVLGERSHLAQLFNQ